ncbi:2'-5' RNA ligase family protein [Streptomyces niveus]|uniref:2'-5' RNA ligase family protein n=1 Tax=Streptomyces niveus TaxID=193462 RepID=UPI00343378B6
MRDFFAGVENRGTNPWPEGRADLHWHLLPPSTPHTVDTLLAPYTQLTRYPGMEEVLPKWLHLTVLHAGPTTTATAPEITQMTDRVRDAVAGTGPIRMTFSRPSIGSLGIERSARPGAPLRRLWDITWKATTAVVGDRWELLPAVPYPHITIAYAGRDAPDDAGRADMKGLLADVDAGEVALEFGTLTLVSQWHTHKRIVWERLAEIPLG